MRLPALSHSAAIFSLASLCALSSPARADGVSLEAHQSLELDSTAYFIDIGQGTNDFLETAKLNLPTTLHLSQFKVKVNPELQADPINNSTTEQYWVDLPEGYLQFKQDTLTIQAGYNTYTWGVTDGFNPLDVVNGRRLQDPLRPEKLGAPSLFVKEDVFSGWSLEGIYIPWQRGTILPGSNSRWLPRQILTEAQGQYNGQEQILYLPTNLQYSYNPTIELDNALENNVGMRIQGQIWQFDVSLEAFNGSSPDAATLINASGVVLADYPPPGPNIIQVYPNVVLTPVDYREWMYGGSVVYAALDCIFRFEAAFTQLISTETNYNLPGNANQYALGIEHGFNIGDRTITSLFEVTYATHQDPADNTSGSLTRIFDRGLLWGLRYAFTDTIAASASALWDTLGHAGLLHADLSWGLTDSLKLTLSGDDIFGDPSTALGAYNDNGRMILGANVAL